MQIRKDQLMRQQVILAHLGFYKGKIDGIWGQSSIEAKKAFEYDVTFIPAIPNSGMPFSDDEKLPKGMRLSLPERLLTYGMTGRVDNPLTESKIAEIQGINQVLPENKLKFVEDDDSIVVTEDKVEVKDSQETEDAVKDFNKSKGNNVKEAPPLKKSLSKAVKGKDEDLL